jgi:hypothetical protein
LNLTINSIIFYCSYPIALGFKLIGKCYSKEDALSMTNLFNTFINNLNMNNKKKEKIKKNIKNNWMCEEWYMQFIDTKRLPINNKPL